MNRTDDFDSGYTKAESDRALDKIINDIHKKEDSLQKKADDTLEYIRSADERLRKLHLEAMAGLDKAIALLHQITASIEADRQAKMDAEQSILCPKCGESVDFEPPYPAEPDTNTAEWNGGYLCECGWIGGEGWAE